MIKFFIDESVHMKTAEVLRSKGYEAVHVVEAGMRGAPDEEVLAEALRRDSVLVSHDSDFHKF